MGGWGGKGGWADSTKKRVLGGSRKDAKELEGEAAVRNEGIEELRPSIYFTEMTKKQLGKVEELLKQEVLPKFQGLGIAVKRAGENGLVVFRSGEAA